MPVHTRVRRIKRVPALKVKAKTKVKRKTSLNKPTHWKLVFQEELRKYGESGLMLRGCRFKAELTQKEVADALDISQHHVSEMEHGKRPIGKEMALRFGQFFKTDYRKFL